MPYQRDKGACAVVLVLEIFFRSDYPNQPLRFARRADGNHESSIDL
jgi:hypothetical protein